MRFHCAISGLILGVLVTLILQSAIWAQNQPQAQRTEAFLKNYLARLERGEATAADGQTLAALVQSAPNAEARKPFLLLAAQYQRLAMKNPAQCVQMLLPALVEPSKVKTWYSENTKALKEAQSQYKKELKAKSKKKGKADSLELIEEKIEEPKWLQAKLPPLNEWNIEKTTAGFAIEIANAIADCDSQTALEIVNTVGQKYSDTTRVLAAECGGDVSIPLKDYSQAMEFYNLALNVLSAMKQGVYVPGEGERVLFTDEQKRIQQRIERKREALRKLMADEQFGLDYTAYKAAQEKHFSGDYLEAVLLYRRVVTDYPETIYAEASRCYLITLLTLFADEENVSKGTKQIQAEQKKLRDLHQKLAGAKRANNTAQMLHLQQEMTAIQQKLAFFTRIPTGLKALQLAEIEAEKFISTEEFGLYRGEVMLAIGLCWLDVFTEPEKAEKWLQRSTDWFEKVSKQAPPVNPPVPEKSRQVSHASDNARYQDEWTNVRDTQLQPGQLFNRRDCPWYLTKHWAQSVTKLGLIAFAKQDFDKAKKLWESLYDIDAYFQEEDEHGLAMSYVKRLLWNIEHNKGALYATPEEMAAFKDLKSRWLLLNADIEMELENYPEAEKKFRKLLKNKKIMSNKNQAAYCNYALAQSLMYQVKMKEGLSILESFFENQKYNGTPPTRRAVEAYGRLLCQFHEIKERHDKGMAALQYLHDKYPNTEEGERALYLLADHSLDKSKRKKYIQMYLQKYPKGVYRKWILELKAD